MRFFAAIFAASVSVSAAFAQTTPNTAGSPASDPAAPRHSCVRPQMLDVSKRVTENQMAAFVSALNKFKECAEGYAQSQQKEAERIQKAAQVTAQALVASGNVAIKDYNDFVEEAGKVMASKPTLAPPPKVDAESRQGSVDTAPSRIPRKN